MRSERGTTQIVMRAAGAAARLAKRRYRTDARQFVAGMFKMWEGAKGMGGETIRPMGMGLRFTPEQVLTRTSPTSMRRLWSQLTGEPMRRFDKGNHPRPWEGPFEGRWERLARAGWTYVYGRHGR